MYIGTYVCMCVHVCVCIHVYVCMYTHMYAYSCEIFIFADFNLRRLQGELSLHAPVLFDKLMFEGEKLRKCLN